MYYVASTHQQQDLLGYVVLLDCYATTGLCLNMWDDHCYQARVRHGTLQCKYIRRTGRGQVMFFFISFGFVCPSHNYSQTQPGPLFLKWIIGGRTQSFWSERSACASGQHLGGHYFR